MRASYCAAGRTTQLASSSERKDFGEAYLLSHRLRQRLTHDCRGEFGECVGGVLGETVKLKCGGGDVWGSRQVQTLSERGEGGLACCGDE